MLSARFSSRSVVEVAVGAVVEAVVVGAPAPVEAPVGAKSKILGTGEVPVGAAAAAAAADAVSTRPVARARIAADTSDADLV